MTVRAPGSLPNPALPAGTANPDMPFDHLIVVMMENHSFDNLFGSLSQTRKDVDGLTFDTSTGKATNSNPVGHDPTDVITAFPFDGTSQGPDVNQSWASSHRQINAGELPKRSLLPVPGRASASTAA